MRYNGRTVRLVRIYAFSPPLRGLLHSRSVIGGLHRLPVAEIPCRGYFFRINALLYLTTLLAACQDKD